MDRRFVVTLSVLASAACAGPGDRGMGPLPSPSAPRLAFVNGVRDVVADDDGNLWFASHDEGVARFDGEAFTYYTSDDGLSHDQVRSLRKGPDGRIWFECGAGLSVLDGGRIVPAGIRNHDRRDDWRVAPGDLWFKGDAEYGATERESVPGVYRYDGASLDFLAFPPLPREDDDGFYYSVTGIHAAPSGRVWFATYGAVLGFDGGDFAVLTNASLGLGADDRWLHVRAVHEDRQGRLWVGNNGIGVLLYEDGVTTNFSDALGVGRAASDGSRKTLHRVFAVAEDRAGNVWFGTVGSGAWRWDGAALTHYGAEDGLACGLIWAIRPDVRGELLFCTADPSGVFRFDGARFEQVF